MATDESEPAAPAGNRQNVNWPLGIVGAVAGGVAGYFVFFWIAQQGFYAIMLPGAAVGLGCGQCCPRASPARWASFRCPVPAAGTVFGVEAVALHRRR